MYFSVLCACDSNCFLFQQERFVSTFHRGKKQQLKGVPVDWFFDMCRIIGGRMTMMMKVMVMIPRPAIHAFPVVRKCFFLAVLPIWPSHPNPCLFSQILPTRGLLWKSKQRKPGLQPSQWSQSGRTVKSDSREDPRSESLHGGRGAFRIPQRNHGMWRVMELRGAGRPWWKGGYGMVGADVKLTMTSMWKKEGQPWAAFKTLCMTGILWKVDEGWLFYTTAGMYKNIYKTIVMYEINDQF